MPAATELMRPRIHVACRLVLPSYLAATELMRPRIHVACRLVLPSCLAVTELMRPRIHVACRLVLPSCLAVTELMRPRIHVACRLVLPSCLAVTELMRPRSTDDKPNSVTWDSDYFHHRGQNYLVAVDRWAYSNWPFVEEGAGDSPGANYCSAPHLRHLQYQR
ncbi:hypothetical protein Pcinc_041228 [Petrolisthes cinctipes]|uniref:Uncharacterized protein n=1 Tax=Petrolisthes cinctipes TaxID=88211 RepID=A0AAE1BK03_PETCI|nr:hypothetical protein Pcinc_041228 [Petrolisthes cinctipes]